MKAVSFRQPQSPRSNALNNATARSNRGGGTRPTSAATGTTSTSVKSLLQPSSTRRDLGFKDSASTSVEGTSNRPLGFVNGDFSSGKVIEIKLQQKSYCIAYDPQATVLTVGTAASLDFYDASNYCLIYSFPHRSMISALSWITLPVSTYMNSGHPSEVTNNPKLLAVCDLDGNILLFNIDLDILESQGPSLLYLGSNASGAQIRSLDAGFYRFMDKYILVIAAGDKSGAVTIVSFDASQFQQPVYMNSMQLHLLYRQDTCMETEVNKSGVLGLSIRFYDGMMAVSSSTGLVQVISLSHILENQRTSDNNGIIWSHQNNGGSIRCVLFGSDTLAFGGYDKTVTLVDTRHWVVSRELTLQGTINTIQFDKRNRYLGIGCRDKTFSIFDTSTFVGIKVFHTLSWVTSISWALDNAVAIRSETNCVTVLDLSPIQQTDISKTKSSHQPGEEATGCISWNKTGQYLVYANGSKVIVSNSEDVIDSGRSFHEVSSIDLHPESIVRTVFCRASDRTDLIGVIDEKSRLLVLQFDSTSQSMQKKSQIDVEPHLKALAWSTDGNTIAVGGRKKLLHVFSADGLEQQIPPISFQGRIWDIDFVPYSASLTTSLFVGVALGDYTTIVLNQSYEPILHITRPLTCRCLKFHPSSPVVAIGDGSGTVVVVDSDDGEIINELDVQNRVTVVEFSPVGDFLIVGTDDCRFTMYESTSYHIIQEIACDGFSLGASFSPNGQFLALGSANDCYNIIRLGPLLGTDLIPLTLEGGAICLPEEVLQQTLFHSGDGPSLLQRHLVRGGPDNLRQVSVLLHDYPKSVYTINRQTGEGCFETVLRLQKPGMVKLFLASLVDGTFLSNNEMQKTFLATSLPHLGRKAITDIANNYPSDFIVDIFKAITFMKVPFGHPRPVQNTDKTECGSTSFNDPWSIERDRAHQLEKSTISNRYFPGGGSMRTPAVLPLPGLGSMSLLASLLSSAPADVFDNEAMALVLRVLWENYIRRYYYFDFCLFMAFFLSWIVLVEMAAVSDISAPLIPEEFSRFMVLVIIVIAFNTLFAAKEVVEGRYGTRSIYWRSMWNTCDLIGIVSVYAYTANIMITGRHLTSLAVCTTMCLTLKVLSYLRGFSSTGWLLSVLSANAQDVRGFLVIITTILVGFSVAFRILFAETGDENFGSLRRSFLSTFELTVMGSYDPMILFETKHTVVAVITFILAITCVVVVALNALISILSDSYARVQENAVANRRREIASLIVEYMSILPPWKRRQIEKQTTWFHTLLEVDADGSLQIHSEDWEGGLNALRNDMEELGKLNRQSCERAVDRLKADLEEDINKFKSDVVSMLEDLVDDVKYLRKMQSQGILNFDPKHNIVKAVRAVKSVGRKGSATLFNGKAH